ncbi:fungal specific transcription factor domain-containing protein [Sarocladium implicatum]|nr:fungal specific transcription factor domain-containing protein [Sarocladium implicatum]
MSMTPASTGSRSSAATCTEDLQQDADSSGSFCTDHSRFSGEVFEAIDRRSGIMPSAVSRSIPFVNASLFGSLDLDPASFIIDISVRALPESDLAEELSRIYFDFIEPIELVLDRSRFFNDLETAYRRSHEPTHPEDDARLSIINLVFALAVQRQESTPADFRRSQGSTYFRRAWMLLRPETVLWQSSGSLESVQSLILMNRYLHCTTHQHKAWITSGLAYRIAQSLLCDNSRPSSEQTPGDEQLRRQVWASCVALDR